METEKKNRKPREYINFMGIDEHTILYRKSSIITNQQKKNLTNLNFHVELIIRREGIWLYVLFRVLFMVERG